ncbi:hypothetical protein LINGRAHAP2_LOCUS16141 [Linum grandiflorum]
MAAALFLILLFTAFRIKDLVVSLAGISDSLFTNRTSSNNSNQNSTICADVKVRNLNVEAFRFAADETQFTMGRMKKRRRK